MGTASTVEEARALGHEAGAEEVRKASNPWAPEWPSDAALDAHQVASKLVDAFRDGWSDGVAAELAVRRGVYPLRAGTDSGGVRFYVADVPVRTGTALAIALDDGTPLRGRLEVTGADTGKPTPWFFIGLAGTTTAGDAGFEVKAWHRFFPASRART